jgi:ferredoxin
MDLAIEIDRGRCIGSGMCIGAAPDVFEHDDYDKAIVRSGRSISSEDSPAIDEAIALCPVAAIRRKQIEGR